MYLSPIEIFESPIHDVIKQFNEEKENYIYQCVADIGVNIDKKELMKALQYDREQYTKGYAEGYADGIEEFIEWLQANGHINFSPERRLELVKEMVGDTE